ncbi:MAG: hypothetical protein BGP16_15465 [Sphingobium sp. 66-54]|nr:MAG: hypothetical protein BGP16_15465 [Sphingobium sp. 66-54]
MPTFNPAAGQVVADEIRTTFDSVDTAVHDSGRLLTTFIEAIRGSDLPPSRSQHALRSLAAGLVKAIDSRAEIINAQRVMVSIKANSNLDTLDFGCLMGPWMSGDRPTPAKAPPIEAA